MRHTVFTLSPLAIAIGLACSPQILAQTDSSLSVKQPIQNTDMEEVRVVGQFQQSLINRIPVTAAELPFTLDVINRDFIDDRAFTRPIDALLTLPNITATGDGRGTGTSAFLSRGFEAPVLVDNRFQNDFRGAGARDDSFVERYEVLKGPASIAAGPVGAGGIINTVTKSPEAERFTTLKLRTDQFGTAVGEFDANVGEVDGAGDILLRVSGAYRDYQFDAEEIKREKIAIRPVATFNIGSATSARASVAYTKNNVNPNTGHPLTIEGKIPDSIDTDTFTSFDNGEGEVKDVLYEAEVNHQFLDNLKLTVRGSKQNTDFDYQNIAALYNYNYGAYGYTGISGTDDETIYTFGFSGSVESETTFYDAQLAYNTQLWGQTQDVVVGIARNDVSSVRSFGSEEIYFPVDIDQLDEPRFGLEDYGDLNEGTNFDSKLSSAFAESAIRPNDYVTVIAGIRYDKVEQVNVRFGEVANYDDSELSLRLGATAQLSDNTNMYASFAQAFVPQFGIKRGNSVVGAETSDGFEIGTKGSVLNDEFTYQAGLFYTLRKNVETRDPSNTIDEDFFLTIGEVRVQGVELSSVYTPTEGLNINLNVGYTDIEVTDGDVEAPAFPELTGSLYISYKAQSGPLQGLSSGGGIRYNGDSDGPLVNWDSYAIVDLNFGYEITDDLELSLDILNVTNEKYIENTSNSTVNTLSEAAILGAPLTTALSLSWTF